MNVSSPRLALYTAGAAAALALLLLVVPMLGNITRFYLAKQDAPVLMLGAGLVMLLSQRLTPRAQPLELVKWQLAALGAALVGLTFAGHWLVLSGHDLSRDEQMASFDTAVFAGGHLVAPLPALWQRHSDALNTLFMLDAPGQQAWISAYLPMNAAIRAAVQTVFGTPWLAGPLLALLGLAAMWGCARRLWPEDRESAVIAVLLYAGSAQVLIAAMSSYAMSAHLTFNLIWLWLFLRRDWRSDLGCLLTGFVATGLHQPLFHPLFALPLLLLVVAERDWKRAALFLVGYGLIAAFWLGWPGQLAELLLATGTPSADGGGLSYLDRLTATLHKGAPERLQHMGANLLRFMAWQPLLLIALLIPGALVARSNRIAAALLGGLGLTVATMLVLLPYQGHGMGYRYLHGLIGNAVLVAIYGFRFLGEMTGKWRALMLRTLIAGTLVLLPLQMWKTHASYAAQAQVSRAIERIDADYFMVGVWDAPFSPDLVYNPPQLDRRPIRLVAESIKPAALADICATRPSVAFSSTALLEPIHAYSGSPRKPLDARNGKLAERFSAAGCRVVQQGFAPAPR